MKVHLEDAYVDLCVEYHTKPVETFLMCLSNTHAAPGGEVFIDASSIEGDHFCVFVELLRLLLKQPNTFIRPTIMSDRTSLSLLTRSSMQQPAAAADDHVFYAIPPRLLRLKLKLSRNANNADVERVCGLVEVQKELSCLPVALPRGGSLLEHGETTGTLSQLTWPEKAVLECVDLCDSVFVSLPGGRALRAATRRNVYLLNVFLCGCSVNRAVIEQIGAATRQNRRRFRAVCVA
ncbi:hypothetical protein ABB37_03097 [Leptomonas pyrrhocoris]|uniref:Uncharacterized protein n=1 Tax=Leptomonas pyrrhocoris TaxID=157538 RepID=A0A0N0DXX3_LEPPY|nr:hypothetical protein ABB37_03097 [Leptomonas pyrrhocoris]KPA83485.1 hypothetical protein ABB37_03097 [Leptomonas pyrrhocoris]|eukprot:XP_015661924.1 hypothetical protein ABB37_03097 [Leptomonas pyrrhocoris]